MLEQNITLANLAEVIGMKADDFSALLFGADGTDILDDKTLLTRISNVVKDERTRYVAEGEKKGKRERMEALEAHTRKKYGTDFRQQGEDLIDAVVGKKENEIVKLLEKLELLNDKKTAFEELPEDKQASFVVNHQLYLKNTQQYKSKIEEHERDFEAFKTEVKTSNIYAMVESMGRKALTEYGPKLPETQGVAEKQIALYLSELKKSNFTIDEAGKVLIPVDKNGDQLKDEDYRIVTFKQYAQQVAKGIFEQHPADPKKNAPTNSGNPSDNIVIPDWTKMKQPEIFELILNEKDLNKKQVYFDSATKFLN